MILGVGKTYKTRNGGTVTITRDNGYPPFTHFGEIIVGGKVERIAYFCAWGSYTGTGAESDFDIASEVNSASEADNQNQ